VNIILLREDLCNGFLIGTRLVILAWSKACIWCRSKI